MSQAIEEQDVNAVLIVALWTIAQLKSDFTREIDAECACFLRFLYTEIGFDRAADENILIEKYLNQNKENTSHLNNHKVRDLINSLADLKVVEITGGKVRIIEKIRI